VWNRVVNLPFAMMRTARSHKAFAPARAAVTAQLAVAIAVLSFAPVAPREPRRDQDWLQLDQAGRTGVELLARGATGAISCGVRRREK